jgi:arylformamidase
MNTIIDISPRLSPKVAVWPGDIPFSRDISLSMAEGANLELSSIQTTVHVGAHTDAPNHYAADGADIASRPLHHYLGLCQIMQVSVPRGERVQPEHLKHPIRAPRVLFRTDTFPDPDLFNTDFAALSPALVDHCHSAGVHLIGLDTPSVDLFDDKALLSHNAIARHDMAILEGVVLHHVPDGLYILIALPLRIEQADASPVRAVLLPPEGNELFPQ